MSSPLLQGPESLRLKVDALGGIDALAGYVRSGGYRRAAQLALEIAATLERLAALSTDADLRGEPRTTVRVQPPQRHRIARQVPTARDQPRRPRLPPGPRYEITEVKD